MTHSLRRSLSVPACALAVLLGCGRGPAAVAPPAPNDGLIDLREMLRRTAAAGEPVPKSPADLRMLDAAYPAAGRFIGSGAIEYAWGARLADGPDAATRVVAHEKTAATSGGFVLLQDGSIRQVTAGEFKTLDKAKP
ncbi:MAG: hypothetical protein ACKO4T_15935 [Planctomycetaceae bacterium]